MFAVAKYNNQGLQETLGAATKPEPYLHVALWFDSNSITYAIFVWDTRAIVEFSKSKARSIHKSYLSFVQDTKLPLTGAGSDAANKKFKLYAPDKLIKLWHVSKQEFTKFKPNMLTFFFTDRSESNALAKNFKAEDYDAYQYMIEIPNQMFNDLVEPEATMQADLLANPTDAELRSGTLGDYLKPLVKAKKPGLVLSDYSQKNYANDAESVALFYHVIKDMVLKPIKK